MSERIGSKCKRCGGIGEVFERDPVLRRDKLVPCGCLDGYEATAEDYLNQSTERERELEQQALNDWQMRSPY